MMTVKCKTPFAKQAVICRTTHLGKPNKGNLFMLKGRKSTVCKQPWKRKSPQDKGGRREHYRKHLHILPRSLLNFELVSGCQHNFGATKY